MKWYMITQGFGLVLGGIIITQAKDDADALLKAYVKWKAEYPTAKFEPQECKVELLDKSKTWLVWNGDY